MLSEAAGATGRVLLLHGILAGPRRMRHLQRAAAAAGFGTCNLATPSRHLPISELVERVHEKWDWIAGHDGPTHILAYSMGGLVARAYIARHRPPNLGRVVMLAPPNGGSEIADLLAGNVLYRRIFGPAGSELVTTPAAAVARLFGTVDYELGIIAGDRFADPLGWLLIPGANDGRVSVERTKVAGMAAHVVLRTSHVGIVRDRAAIAHAVGFLRHGHFS